MLDGYHFGYETQLAFARRARKLLVVDDTAEAPRLAGHVLLNQNPGAESLPYGEAPPERLLGPRYALLGRRFRLAQRREGREPALAERVLVTFGGADPDNVTLAVLEALEPELPAHVRVLVGPANPHHGSLARWTASRRNVELLRGATDLPAVMRWADLAVSAPGTTVFELAWLGVPMLLTAIASNQLGSGASLSESGAALYCGPFGPAAAAELRSQFRALLRDPSRRASLARTARSLIDGRGAERVANVLRS
jgi:spore coat polysaccharide biosynthesis predicted glycosyltransferase SpsG